MNEDDQEPTARQYERVLRDIVAESRLSKTLERLLRHHLKSPDLIASHGTFVRHGIIKGPTGIHTPYGAILGRTIQNRVGYMREYEFATTAFARVTGRGRDDTLNLQLRYPFALAVARVLGIMPPKRPKTGAGGDPAREVAETILKSSEQRYADEVDRRRVEIAAVKFATAELQKRGFAVESRERDRVGYDLDAWSPSRRLRIEIKGTRGIVPACFLTANEYRALKTRTADRIWIVTEALNWRRRDIHEFTPGEFVRKFDVAPTQYQAKLNRTAKN